MEDNLQELIELVYHMSNPKEVLKEIGDKLKILNKITESNDIVQDNSDMIGILKFLMNKLDKYIKAMNDRLVYIKKNHESILQFMAKIVNTEKVFISFTKDPTTKKWKKETIDLFKKFEDKVKELDSIIDLYNKSDISEIKIPDIDSLRKMANEQGIVKF